MPKFKNMEDYGATKEVLYDLYVNRNMTIKEVGEKYGISETLVYRWFKDCSIKTRSSTSKFYADYSYFDAIDTEEKAYWLGFVWCDGSINWSKTNPMLQLNVAERDRSHLEKFKKHINSNHSIGTYQKGSGFNNTHLYKECRFSFTSKHLSELLRDKYGMIPNRSSIDKLVSSVPDSLLRHFIRGVLMPTDHCQFTKFQRKTLAQIVA